MDKISFFNEQTEQSLVKTTIVEKYFDAWTKIILSTQKPTTRRSDERIGYIDLFAGPGFYQDGSLSTPLKILKKAIENTKLRDRFLAVFNDNNKKYAYSLEVAINKLPGIDKLKYKPKVFNKDVGEEIAKMFEQMKLIPTLFFVDPWGYKGLSLRLINLNSVLTEKTC